MFHADGQVDRQTGRQTDMMKIIIAFCNFTNLLKHGTGTGFSLCTSVFFCKYTIINALDSLIHLISTRQVQKFTASLSNTLQNILSIPSNGVTMERHLAASGETRSTTWQFQADSNIYKSLHHSWMCSFLSASL
jgi:hypothetical protein